MFSYLKRRKRLASLTTRLEQCLNGHNTVNKKRLLMWFDQVSADALKNGKVIKMNGTKTQTLLSWVQTHHVCFTDNTSRPLTPYRNYK